MRYDAMSIADFILKYYHKRNEDEPDVPTHDGKPPRKSTLSNLRLQTLLYLCVVDFYYETNGMLLIEEKDSTFKAWPSGPVIPTVFFRYCLFGGNKILYPTAKRTRTAYPDPKDISDKIASVIEKFLENSYNTPTRILVVNSTLCNGPWYHVYIQSREDNSSRSISFDEIKSHANRIDLSNITSGHKNEPDLDYGRNPDLYDDKDIQLIKDLMDEGYAPRALTFLVRYMARVPFSDEAKDFPPELYQYFTAVYADDFNHNPSTFFRVLNNVDEEMIGSLSFLSFNVEKLLNFNDDELKKHIEDKTNPDPAKAKEASTKITVAKKIERLCDHLTLEIMRHDQQLFTDLNAREAHRKLLDAQIDDALIRNAIANIKSEVETAREEMKKYREESKSARRKLEVAQKQSKAASEDASSMKREMVAVLGIFAAIMITFVGGLSYITGAVSSLQEAPIYNSLLIVSVSGFILFNTIYMLISIVAKINKSSLHLCRAYDCSECKKLNKQEDGTIIEDNRCHRTLRFFKRLHPLVWTNLFILAAIIFAIILM